jgi:ribosome maturation factor RimP
VRVKTETGRARGEVVSAGEKTVQIEHGNGPVEISYDEIVRANLIDEGTKG